MQWAQLLGPTPLKHVTFGYAEQIRETLPDEAFRGKAVVGLFFGQESCPHCGPFLQSLMALLEQHSDATAVFISRCASAEDTTQYFGKMPYLTAMPHEAVAGQRGAGLFK